MKRRHLFEFNDSPWAPVALRETVIEALSRTLAWGHVLRGGVAPFRAFLAATGAEEVLDVCSGAGGPAAIFATEIARAGARPPRFLMTDLQPQLAAWAEIRDEHPGVIDFVSEPVDATRIPESVGTGRARIIINSLHHFPPDLAASIVRGACESSPGVFIIEGFERNPLRFAAFAAAGIPALLVNPVLSHHHRAQKALLTYLLPAALLVSLWDGLVSTMRIYTEADLREMVRPLGDAFVWTYGTWEFAPLGRATFFYGVRKRRDA
jgi:hypothetical protein